MRSVPQQVTPHALPTRQKLLLISYYPVTTIVGWYFSRSVCACWGIDRQNHSTLFESGNNGHHTSCNLEQHQLRRLSRMTIQGWRHVLRRGRSLYSGPRWLSRLGGISHRHQGHSIDSDQKQGADIRRTRFRLFAHHVQGTTGPWTDPGNLADECRAGMHPADGVSTTITGPGRVGQKDK